MAAIPKSEWREEYIFREVTPPLPRGWEPGHWQVEAHRISALDGAAYLCPVAIAWVNCVGVEAGTLPPLVEFVHTLPQFQRQGVAKRLLQEVFKRWPNAEMTDGISKAGQRLISAIERDEAKDQA